MGSISTLPVRHFAMIPELPKLPGCLLKGSWNFLGFTLPIVLAVLGGGCGDQKDYTDVSWKDIERDERLYFQKLEEIQSSLAKASKDRYVEAGDLSALERRGRLRILTEGSVKNSYLPRNGFPIDHELREASEFARSLGLEPEVVIIRDWEQLIPALIEGRGDLIAANLTVTPGRERQIAFSSPIGTTREQIVSAANNDAIKSVDDLAGRTVYVTRGTSFEDSVMRLQRKIPGVQIGYLNGTATHHDIFEQLAAGKIELAVDDDNVIRNALEYRSDIRPLFNLTEPRLLAWAVRRDASELLERLNEFLSRHLVTAPEPELAQVNRDWPEMVAGRTLRMITRNSGATYFYHRGELVGFEYEMVRKFAQEHDLNVEVYVAASDDEMLAMLREGKGDLVAAFLKPSEYSKSNAIAFSVPYHLSADVVVARAGESRPMRINDLSGRTIVVGRSSSYWETLGWLQKKGVDFQLKEAPPGVSEEDLIEGVARGEYDLTVVSEHLAELELRVRDDVRIAFPVTLETPHGWAVRAGSGALMGKINEFWAREYRGLVHNVTYRKYFTDPKKIKDFHIRNASWSSPSAGRLSPYDKTIKSNAEGIGFDWQLIVAQVFQESRFNPSARSFAGARGVMQVMPATARQVGVAGDLMVPWINIKAGVKYLGWVIEQLSDEIEAAEKKWFALAAYNVGLGHVYDARELAEKNGWDPNLWFDNVEKAIVLLSNKSYAQKARHGYCRGREPVNYVREIRRRYQGYLQFKVQGADA